MCKQRGEPLRPHFNSGQGGVELLAREGASCRDCAPHKFFQGNILAVPPRKHPAVPKLCELLFSRDDVGRRRPRPRPTGARGIDAPRRWLKLGQRALIARLRGAPGAAHARGAICNACELAAA